MKKKQYVIGVDGGGTKTKAALADLQGRVLKIAKSGSSSPVNVGVEIAVENIAKAIKKVLRKGEILSTFIGLAAIQEEPRFKKQIKKELLNRQEISQILKGKLEIGSDQIAAFRSGTDEKDGVLLISGTGCVAHGWRGDRETHVSGWHWLADEGSAFWVGQQAFQAVFKDLDGRGAKTLITDLAFKKFKVKSIEGLLKKVYGSINSPQVQENFVRNVSLLSILVDKASQKSDKAATKILEQAGKELALSAKTVIKGLRFQKKKFPLILVGGMFKSGVVLEIVKKEVKRIAPDAKFIRPRQEPVIGAVKLALEKCGDTKNF